MREILFRGKRRDNGEWVEGYYCKCPDKSRTFLTDCILVPWHDTKTGKEYCIAFPVIFETISQFTGSTDKNGTKIFEGDIIENITNHNTAVVRWYEEHAAFMLHSKLKHKVYFLYDNDFKSINVIGNIYDNPELLGV